jgi:hypothetical protein
MSQPETAWTWAMSIGNEQTRQSSLAVRLLGAAKERSHHCGTDAEICQSSAGGNRGTAELPLSLLGKAVNQSTKRTLLGCTVAIAFGAAMALIFKPSPAPAVGSNGGGPARANESSRPINAALQESIRNGTGTSRWLQLLSTLEKAKAEDMPGLIRLAGNDSAMIRMLAARWAELDPDHMFRSLYADFMLPDGAPRHASLAVYPFRRPL